jgi:hypothetical protein
MKITVNIATHQKREKLLKRSLHSLLHQNISIDALNVVFNDYKKPDWFVDLEKSHSYLKGHEAKKDLKAASKFANLSKCADRDIYLTCDDDIFYPKNYVRYIVDLAVITAGPIAFDGTVISTAGDIIHKIPFDAGNANAIPVNLGGTGTVALTGKDFKDFKAPKNYTDVDLAAHAQKKRIAFTCPVRAAGFLKPLEGHFETSIQRGSYHLEKLKKVASEAKFKMFMLPSFSFTDFGGWSIEFETFKRMLSHSFVKLAEFGTGKASKYLDRWFECVHIEEDIIFGQLAAKENLQCFHASIKNGWYDLNEHQIKHIKKAEAYLVDGPKGDNRKGILKNLSSLNEKAVFFVDDCHRQEDRNTAEKLAELLKRQATFVQQNEKKIAII